MEDGDRAGERRESRVEALITRAQAMRTWLLTATDCSCTSLDVCALFATDEQVPPLPGDTAALSITHVPAAA